MLLYRCLHGFQLGKVLAHVRVQDHVDDQVTKIAKISLLHVGENVAVMLLDQPVRYIYFLKGCVSVHGLMFNGSERVMRLCSEVLFI